MAQSPFSDKALCGARQCASQNLAGLDLDHRLVRVMDRMKVWRRMIVEEHPD
jgi:hypothetical protein